MKGLDLSNQLISYLEMNIKTIILWKRYFRIYKILKLLIHSLFIKNILIKIFLKSNITLKQ